MPLIYDGMRYNNMFNSSAVTAVNNTCGPAWQQPNAILAGRLAKY